jgi:type IV secretion system protein VirD4
LRSPPGCAAIIVGPPKAGKTRKVIAPTFAAWAGPALVTSTKGDILASTGHRSRIGPVAVYYPTGSLGHAEASVGFSPLSRCQTWDGAVEVAAALLSPASADETVRHGEHFAIAARALLAPLFHAAASRAAVRASSDPALTPQIDLGELIAKNGTLYVISPSRIQEELAPLIAALLDALCAQAIDLAITSPTGRLKHPLLLALDEVAKIAPIRSLPRLAMTKISRTSRRCSRGLRRQRCGSRAPLVGRPGASRRAASARWAGCAARCRVAAGLDRSGWPARR